MKLLKDIFVIAIITASLSAVSAAQSGTLVAGNPALTRERFESILTYYGRALFLDFSDAQRARLEKALKDKWRAGQRANAKNLENFIKTVETINAWDHDKLERVQGELTEAVLADLRSGRSNEFDDYLLTMYEQRGSEEFGEESAADVADDEPVKDTESVRTEELFEPASGVSLAQLAGKWNKGSVSSYGYRNTVTNDYRSAYGAANMHEIRANGSFDYSNFAQVSGYGCTTELFTSMKGRASVSGSTVTLTYLSGTVKGKDSCKSTGFSRPAQIAAGKYRLERSNGQLRMCEIGKENPTCLYKEE